MLAGHFSLRYSYLYVFHDTHPFFYPRALQMYCLAWLWEQGVLLNDGDESGSQPGLKAMTYLPSKLNFLFSHRFQPFSFP